MKKSVFTLVLGVLTLLSVMVDRAEASTIMTVSVVDTSSSGTGFNSVSLSPPLVDPASGSLASSAGGFGGTGFASATVQFGVSAATDIVLNCTAPGLGSVSSAFASLLDVTTGQFLFQCPVSNPPNPFPIPNNSGTVPLNTTDTYRLNTNATGGPLPEDFVRASLNFSGDFSIETPEPSTLWLLGMALIALGLVRKRLEAC